MNAWQLAAAVLAGFLIVVALVLVLRFRQLHTLVLALITFVSPAVGFAAYSMFPGPQPPASVALTLSVILYAVAFVGTVFSIINRWRNRRAVLTVAALDRMTRRGFVARLFIALWLTALLLPLEPAFAIANLAINVLWECAWIPMRWRVVRYEHTAEIAAPPDPVFNFITDTANWPLYRDDVEIVGVDPPGPLRVGTLYTLRLPIPASPRVRHPRQLELRSVVANMVPGRSYMVMPPDRPRESGVTTLEPTAGGTRITVSANPTISFVNASQGAVLRAPAEFAARHASDTKRFARLSQVLTSG